MHVPLLESCRNVDAEGADVCGCLEQIITEAEIVMTLVVQRSSASNTHFRFRVFITCKAL